MPKRQCFDAIDDDNALQVVLPWLLQEFEETRDLMGKDYWPYGVRSNKIALDAMVRYAHEQGLTAKPVPIEKLSYRVQTSTPRFERPKPSGKGSVNLTPFVCGVGRLVVIKWRMAVIEVALKQW